MSDRKKLHCTGKFQDERFIGIIMFSAGRLWHCKDALRDSCTSKAPHDAKLISPLFKFCGPHFSPSAVLRGLLSSPTAEAGVVHDCRAALPPQPQVSRKVTGRSPSPLLLSCPHRCAQRFGPRRSGGRGALIVSCVGRQP